MVAAPTLEHFALCRFFLENGKHVMVEKPISRTLAEADELIALAAARKRVLAVGHLERFNPAVQYAGAAGGRRRCSSKCSAWAPSRRARWTST